VKWLIFLRVKRAMAVFLHVKSDRIDCRGGSRKLYGRLFNDEWFSLFCGNLERQQKSQNTSVLFWNCVETWLRFAYVIGSSKNETLWMHTIYGQWLFYYNNCISWQYVGYEKVKKSVYAVNNVSFLLEPLTYIAFLSYEGPYFRKTSRSVYFYLSDCLCREINRTVSIWLLY
jgi:hypothetical protein